MMTFTVWGGVAVYFPPKLFRLIDNRGSTAVAVCLHYTLYTLHKGYSGGFFYRAFSGGQPVSRIPRIPHSTMKKFISVIEML